MAPSLFITDRAKGSLRGSGVGFLVLSLRAMSGFVFQFRLANPTNIANANPDPPTPADRVVPIHGWRLAIVPCGLVLCAHLCASLVCAYPI